MNINRLMATVKQRYAAWAKEQDQTSPMYRKQVEDFFSSYLYGDLVDWYDKTTQAEIGRYVKTFMPYVDGVLADIDETEKQRVLGRR